MSTIDADLVARLLDLVERSDVAELELTIGDARLRLVKSHGTAPALAPPLAKPPPAAAPSGTAAPVPPASQPAPKLHAVRAGFPGTFYRAPAPGDKPFAEEGERVEDGRQLGIVEAMKTMNPVEADIAGTLVRIALPDATPVETGDVLFEIEP